MAEANDRPNGRGTLPQRGSVKKEVKSAVIANKAQQMKKTVCEQWLVHEDGALAYQIQNKEIEQHYGLNRYNRRTVREDIPVAKVVQSEEERRQQEERFQELQALRAQEEEDAEVAKRVTQEMLGEEEARQRQRELEDEEIARQYHEKEQKKYDKYLERRRGKELKREREILEKQLEQHTVDARLVTDTGVDPSTGYVDDQMRDLSVEGRDRGSYAGRHNGATRITPSGIIEDDGDFSDFFAIPDDVNESERKVIQEVQDEELARLLQEQEHKRTKAEVDRNKLKEIEEQDARLAKIIQEQEKLRLKRAKQRKKQQQQEEARRQQQMVNNSNPASRPLPDLPGQRVSTSPTESPVPPNQRPTDLHRLRRNSFIQGIDNGPVPLTQSNVNQSQKSARQHSQETSMHSSQRQRQNGSVDLSHDSAREVERWLAGTELPPAPRSHPHTTPRGRLRSDQSENSDHHMPPSPSPPGSYHSDREEIPYRPCPPYPGNTSTNHEPCYAVSNPIPFNNIAAAIDPTFKRRQHEIHQSEETDIKVPVVFSQSLPAAGDTELEWDPSLRGSLRRPKGTWNPLVASYGESTISRDDSFSDEGPVISPWQPVQGQKRSTMDKRPKAKPKPSPAGNQPKGQKNNCKQQ